MNNHHHIGEYEYETCAYINAVGEYQGVILVTGRSGVPYNPIVEIQTPTTFLAQKDAQFEAEALALELIHKGALSSLLSLKGNSSWPTPSNLSLRTKD